MGAHVRNGRGLSRSPGGRGGCGRMHLARSPTSDEATANLTCRVEFTACEGSGAGDGISGTTVAWCFRFEQG